MIRTRFFTQHEIAQIPSVRRFMLDEASNTALVVSAIPCVTIDPLNKRIYDFLFRTNYSGFAGPNPFQPVADFTAGITTMFVLEEG